jgi:hypothetical protein
VLPHTSAVIGDSTPTVIIFTGNGSDWSRLSVWSLYRILGKFA